MATLTQAGITFGDGTSQTSAAVSFPTGTLMLFQQTAAPTGWTKQATHDNKALRVVSGTASSGGTSTFTTVFANQTPTITVGATTLTTTQMPSHSHTVTDLYTAFNQNASGLPRPGNTQGATPLFSTNSQGGGGSHTHSGSSTAITLNVQYVDIIIASKD